MALQRRMLFLPTDAELISAHLAAARHDGRLTFFDASGPIFSCREADDGALRFAAAMLTEPALGLAGPSQMARAVGRHRSRVHEYRTRYRAGGAAALEVKRRGPRGARKLKGGVLVRAQEGLAEGRSNRTVAAQVGVSEQTIRKGLKDGRLVRPQGAGRTGPMTAARSPASTPRERSDEDASCGGGRGDNAGGGTRLGADRAAGGSDAAVRSGRVGGQGGRAGGVARPARARPRGGGTDPVWQAEKRLLRSDLDAAELRPDGPRAHHKHRGTDHPCAWGIWPCAGLGPRAGDEDGAP